MADGTRNVTFVLDMKDLLSQKFANAMKGLSERSKAAIAEGAKTQKALNDQQAIYSAANKKMLNMQMRHAAQMARASVAMPGLVAEVQKRFDTQAQMLRTANKTEAAITSQGARLQLANEARKNKKLAEMKAAHEAALREINLIAKGSKDAFLKQQMKLEETILNAQYKHDIDLLKTKSAQRQEQIALSTQVELSVWSAFHAKKAEMDKAAAAKELALLTSQRTIGRIAATNATLLAAQQKFHASKTALATQSANMQLDIQRKYLVDSQAIAYAVSKGSARIQSELAQSITAMANAQAQRLMTLETLHGNNLAAIKSAQAAGQISIEQAKDAKLIEMDRNTKAVQISIAQEGTYLARVKATAATELAIAKASEKAIEISMAQSRARRLSIQTQWDQRKLSRARIAAKEAEALLVQSEKRRADIQARWDARALKRAQAVAERTAAARNSRLGNLGIGGSGAVGMASQAAGGAIGKAGSLVGAMSPAVGYAGYIGSALMKAGPIVAASVVGIMALVKSIQLLGSAFSFAMKTGMDFEAAMSNIASVVRPSATGLKELTAMSRQLGKTSVYTATQVAEAFLEMGKLGFTTNEILLAGNSVLGLAQSTGASMEASALSVSKTLRQFGLDASETTRVVDGMTYAFSRSALDMAKYDETMKYAGPIAKAAGLSFEQVTSYMAAMADQGVDATRAGTALRTMFIELSNEGSKANKMLRKTGFVTKDKSVAEKIKELAKYKIELATLQTVFTKYASTGAQTLLDSLTKSNELLEDMKTKAAGFAQETARMRLDRLEGDIKILKSVWQEAGLAIFDAIGPGPRKMIQELSASVTELSDFVKENATTIRLVADALASYLTTVADGIKKILKVTVGNMVEGVTEGLAQIQVRENEVGHGLHLSDTGSYKRWKSDMTVLRERWNAIQLNLEAEKKAYYWAKQQPPSEQNEKMMKAYNDSLGKLRKLKQEMKEGAEDFTNTQLIFWQTDEKALKDSIQVGMQNLDKLAPGMKKAMEGSMDFTASQREALMKHALELPGVPEELKRVRALQLEYAKFLAWLKVFGRKAKDAKAAAAKDDRKVLAWEAEKKGRRKAALVPQDKYYWMALAKETVVKYEQETWDALQEVETIETQKRINALKRSQGAYLVAFSESQIAIRRKIATDERLVASGNLLITDKSILQTRRDLVKLTEAQANVENMLTLQVDAARIAHEKYLNVQKREFMQAGKMAALRAGAVQLKNDPMDVLKNIEANLALKQAERLVNEKAITKEFERQRDLAYKAKPKMWSGTNPGTPGMSEDIKDIEARMQARNRETAILAHQAEMARAALRQARTPEGSVSAFKTNAKGDLIGVPESAAGVSAAQAANIAALEKARDDAMDRSRDYALSIQAAQTVDENMAANARYVIAKFQSDRISQLKVSQAQQMSELEVQMQAAEIEAANARFAMYQENFDKIVTLQSTLNDIQQVWHDIDVDNINRRFDLEEARTQRLVDARLVSDRTANVMRRRNEMQKEKDLKKAFAAQKKWQVAGIVMNTAQAIMGTWAGYASMGPVGTALAFAQSAALAGLGASQIAQVDAQRMATGGFPRGANAMVQMNERGQESVLNASATARVGRRTINALNSGKSLPTQNNSTTSQTFIYSPSHTFETSSQKVDILTALENDREGFSKFVTDSRRRGYKV